MLVPHVAEMKRRLHFLRSQHESRRRAAARFEWHLADSPTTCVDTLMQQISSHYTQQTEQLVPQLQQLVQQCERSQEYGKAVQAAVSDCNNVPSLVNGGILGAGGDVGEQGPGAVPLMAKEGSQEQRWCYSTFYQQGRQDQDKISDGADKISDGAVPNVTKGSRREQ
ncbi:unnamed protein product [Ranitomeya imitator]|uniref:Uncharacterized protein n=1 Tax=Ranitomeya imitator TaxID=111125 RepID=A0ABN9LWB1_9NEOB|nr:unnamed protein product [Ranitomeya imitator]